MHRRFTKGVGNCKTPMQTHNNKRVYYLFKKSALFFENQRHNVAVIFEPLVGFSRRVALFGERIFIVALAVPINFSAAAKRYATAVFLLVSGVATGAFIGVGGKAVAV